MSPRSDRGRWLAMGVLALTIGVGVTAVARAGSGGEADIHAWIDTPLSGTVVDPGPIEVLAHATDAGGVTGIRLLVDGESTGDVVDVSGTLAQAAFTVDLDVEGEHDLVAVGLGASGESRSEPVRIVVGSPDDSTTTTISTTSSTSTTLVTETTVPPETTVARTVPPTIPTTAAPTVPPTVRPTTPTMPPTVPPTTPTTVAPTTPPTTTTVPPTTPPTTCTLVAPGVVSPAGSATNNSTSISFVWRYGGPCNPASFIVQVSQDRSFSTIAASARVDGGARSVTLTVPCIVGTWQWRVGPSSSPSGSNPGPWSSSGVFNRTACR